MTIWLETKHACATRTFIPNPSILDVNINLSQEKEYTPIRKTWKSIHQIVKEKNSLQSGRLGRVKRVCRARAASYCLINNTRRD